MTAEYIVSDVLDGLATLETGSVDLVVTSPPFLALRSYLPADHELKAKEMGSEPTPAAFIDGLLVVMAELRRVVAPHGSVCVELGDTYANTISKKQPDYKASDARKNNRVTLADGRTIQSAGIGNGQARSGNGWPFNKSLSLIPESFRMALAYGFNPHTGAESPAGKWRIRNVVRWVRPNPPVGALGDKWRPATSELVVACTSGKRFWDDLATRKINPNGQGIGKPAGVRTGERSAKEHWANYEGLAYSNPSGAPLLDWWEIPPGEQRPDPKVGEQDRSIPELLNHGGHMGTSEHGAPLLDWWNIPPGGYTGSHYAVFPPELVEPCVKAMAPLRVCTVCGEPSRRMVAQARIGEADDSTRVKESGNVNGWEPPPENGWEYERHTLGWTDCGHDSWRAGVVLDPFAGSGTTLLVADALGYEAIGIDIDARNRELWEKRGDDRAFTLRRQAELF